MKKLISLFCAAAVLNLTACGTILYPERVGQQKTGRIDPAVAILDGVGLLVFIIPGLIAYAVDFSNGTIYLPRETSFEFSSDDDLIAINVGKDHLSQSEIDDVVSKKIGKHINSGQAEIYKLKDDGTKIPFNNNYNMFRS